MKSLIKMIVTNIIMFLIAVPVMMLVTELFMATSIFSGRPSLKSGFFGMAINGAIIIIIIRANIKMYQKLEK